MSVFIIENIPFELADVEFAEDETLPSWAEHILRELKAKRLRTRMNYWLSRQSEQPTPAQFQAQLDTLSANFEFTDEPEEDAIMEEALDIAEELIRARLAVDALPPPRNIREHAAALVAADASLLDSARSRVLARLQTRDEILRSRVA